MQPQLDVKASNFVVPKKEEKTTEQPVATVAAPKQDAVLQQASATGGFGNKQTS